MSVLAHAVLPLVIRTIIRALGVTYRYQIIGWGRLAPLIAANSPIVVAFFHGRQACLTHFMTRPERGPWTIMVSQSRDGDLQNKILNGLGLLTVRGSSGRGGARALVDLVRAIRQPETRRISMAVDGSRGPIWEVKPGVVTLAVKGNASLVALVGAADRSWIFRRSWDQFCIPKPWARVAILVSRPVQFPNTLSPQKVAVLRDRLQVLMDAMRQRAGLVVGDKLSKKAQQ